MPPVLKNIINASVWILFAKGLLIAIATLYTAGMAFYPDHIHQDDISELHYGAQIAWIEIEKDELGFLSFIDEVMGVLELSKAPEYSPNCQWCKYLNTMASL